MDGGIDADTERHRDNNHVVDTDFPELEQVGKHAKKSERHEGAHAERNTTCKEELRFAERNHERTENHEDNHERKSEAILLHRFNHVRKDELRGERAEVFAVKVPAAVAFLESVQRLRIPTREITVNESNLSVTAVLFTQQVERPFRNVFGGKGLLDGGKLAERGDIRRIFTFGTVEHAGLGEVTNFFDNFKAGFLRIQRRHKRLERKEAAERRILFHMQANHQRVIKQVELFGLTAHHCCGSRRCATIRTGYAGSDAVALVVLFRRHAAQVTQVVFEVYILSKPDGNRTEGKPRKGRILEELEDFRLVPRLGQQAIFGSLRDTAHALDKHREHEHRGEHTEQHARGSNHAEFIETPEVSGKQREERGNRRETCEKKRLEHLALCGLEHLLESRVLVHEFLRCPENVYRVVNSDTQDNGCDKDGERVELSVDERRKRERRDTGVEHGGRHKNRALHAAEENHREEDDQHEAYAEGEYGIVRHVVHFLEAFVRAFHGESCGNGVSLAVEICEKRIGPGKDMRHELVVGRGLDEFRVHHAVEQDLARTVGFGATDETGTQFRRNGLLLVPFLRLGFLHLDGIRLVLLEEGVEGASGLIGEAKFLRDVGTEPYAFLLGRGRRRFTRIAGGIRCRLVAQQVHDQRAVLAPDFELQVFQVVTDILKVLHRQVEKGVVLEELVVVIDLGRDKIALPVLVDVLADRILQCGHQVHVLALDGNHEAVGASKTLVGFLEGLHARSVFRQQVREVGVELEPRLEENRYRKQHRKNEVEGQGLVLVPADQGYIPVGKTFYQGFFASHTG